MSQKNQANEERFKKEAMEYFRSFEFDLGGFDNYILAPGDHAESQQRTVEFKSLLFDLYGSHGSEWLLAEAANEVFRRALRARVDIMPVRRRAKDLVPGLIDECVAEVADFFASLPRRYSYYVPLPYLSGHGRGRMDVAPGFHFEEFLASSSRTIWETAGVLMDSARAGRGWDLRHELDDGVPYLCVCSQGLFASNSRSGPTTNAFSAMKRFLFLAGVCDKQFQSGRLGHSTARTGFVVDDSLGLEKAAPILLPDALCAALAEWGPYPWGDASTEYLADCGLPPPPEGATDRLLTKSEQERAFAVWFPLVARALSDMERYGTTLLACEWAFDSVYESRPAARVMFLGIAFEALLPRSQDKGGITQHLVASLVELLCVSGAERKEVEKRFKAFYELRSRTAHGELHRLAPRHEEIYGAALRDFTTAIERKFSADAPRK